jgi:hypothetical protein
MLSHFLLVTAIAVGIVAALNVGDAQSEDFKDGVSLRGSQNAAVPGGVNTFDPPCSFASTLPFDKSVYLNPKTEIRIVGRGALLNECANFGVTGFSAPNFLAWNCNVNIGGTTASLPVVFQFSNLVRGVSLKVGSNIAGSAKLVGLSSSGAVVAKHTVTLTSAMQSIIVRQTRQIKSAQLTGPCIMIADDLRVIP